MAEKKKFDIKDWKPSEKILEMASKFEPGNRKSEKQVLEKITNEIKRLEEIKKYSNDDRLLSENAQKINEGMDALNGVINQTLQRMADQRNEQSKGFFYKLFRRESRFLKALVDNEIYDKETKELNLENFKQIEGLNLGKSVVTTETWNKLNDGLKLECEFEEKFKGLAQTQSIDEIVNNWGGGDNGNYDLTSKEIKEKNELWNKNNNVDKEVGKPNSLKYALESCGVSATFKATVGAEKLDFKKSDKETYNTMVDYENNFDKISKEILKSYEKSTLGIKETQCAIMKLGVLYNCVYFAKCEDVDDTDYVDSMKKAFPKLSNTSKEFIKKISESVISAIKHLSAKILGVFMIKFMNVDEKFVKLPSLKNIMSKWIDNYKEALESSCSVDQVYYYIGYAYSDARNGLNELVEKKLKQLEKTEKK